MNYTGVTKFAAAPGGILVVELRTQKIDQEWQLLQSFMGYLDRHFGEHIERISIAYR